jgi:Kdo2-lipid IVA lauroyltransferase/acyltransferase
MGRRDASQRPPDARFWHEDMTDGRIRDEAPPPLRRLYKRSRLRRLLRRRRDAAFYHLTRAALVLPRAVSLPRALAIADRTADLVYPTLPGIRRLALDHLAIAFGDTLSAAAREDIARAAYRNAARCFVEVAKIDDIVPCFDAYVSMEGWEHLERFRAFGRTAIVVTGHVGNWELLAAYVARAGIPLAASARRIADPRLNKLVNDFRTRSGMRVILRNSPNSGFEILKTLKQRGVLALQIDQDIRVPSVSVPFFGRLARTPAAAALLAIRRNLPAVPVFAQRRPQGGHHFTVMPPIHPPKTGDLRRDILDLTSQFSRILEDHIRRNPTEWNWWHRRWRRGPVPHLDLDADSGPSHPVSP